MFSNGKTVLVKHISDVWQKRVSCFYYGFYSMSFHSDLRSYCHPGTFAGTLKFQIEKEQKSRIHTAPVEPQGNQYSPSVYCFSTLRSFFGTNVVGKYMRGKMRMHVQFHHRSATEAAHRPKGKRL